MTNALADSDVCKDSTAAGVLAKEGGGRERERERERNRRKGGREEGRKTIQSHLRLMTHTIHTFTAGFGFLAFRKTSIPQLHIAEHVHFLVASGIVNPN